MKSKVLVEGNDGNRHVYGLYEIIQYDVTDDGHVVVPDDHLCRLCSG